jgi:aminoglycoside 6-adenylyltransferase
MIANPDQNAVLRDLIHWADRQEAVRAMLLTSSRAEPDAPVDIFSDYDVVLVVRDLHPFFEERSWLQDFGDILVVYWDPIYFEPECDHDWSIAAGHMGKGMKVQLPSGIWSELEHTYVGAGLDENWEALFQTMVLFRRVAIDVGGSLGYAYSHDLDARVTAYVRAMRGVEARR